MLTDKIIVEKPQATPEISKSNPEPVKDSEATPEIIKPNPEPVKDSRTTQEASKANPEPVKDSGISAYTAYFSPNNTQIQDDTAVILKNIAKELINNPKAIVEIAGYCAMTGTEEGREELSKERAYNVSSYLKSQGWIPETAPVIKWYGGLNPVTYEENEIYRNRRVEIRIVSQ